MVSNSVTSPAGSAPGPFTLGTAQLGLAYGLGEARSGLSDVQANEILDAAAKCNIIWIDTARNYGCSENRIGDFMAARNLRFRVVSKLPSLASVPDTDCAKAVRIAINESQRALRIERIDVYLAHRAADFQRLAVREALVEAQSADRIGCYGTSVYSVEEAETALKDTGLRALQIPISVVTHATAKPELLEQARIRGILVFARSVFLQGALLMEPGSLPAHLTKLSPVLVELQSIADRAQVSLAALLMAATRGFPGVFSPVLGTDSASQLIELAAQARLQPAQAVLDEAFRAGAGLPQSVTDPRTWPK